MQTAEGPCAAVRDKGSVLVWVIRDFRGDYSTFGEQLGNV